MKDPRPCSPPNMRRHIGDTGDCPLVYQVLYMSISKPRILKEVGV